MLNVSSLQSDWQEVFTHFCIHAKYALWLNSC